MRKTQKRLKVLRKSEKLINVLKDMIKEYEGRFSTIRVEKNIISNFSNLEKVKMKKLNGIYSLELDGYRIKLDFGEPKDNWQWCVIWEVKSPEGEVLYQYGFGIEDHLNNLIQGVDVWIRRRGSKNKTGEL